MARAAKPKPPTKLELAQLVSALHEDTHPFAVHPMAREGTGRAIVTTLETVSRHPETLAPLLELWRDKYGIS